MSAWQSIDTAPKDGSEFEATHSRALPGYIAIARWDAADSRWVCSLAFIGADRRLYWQPDQWRRLSNQRGEVE